MWLIASLCTEPRILLYPLSNHHSTGRDCNHQINAYRDWIRAWKMLTNTAKNWDFFSFSFSEMDRKSDDARRKLRVIPREMLLVHGLWMPNEAFFFEIQNFWAWLDKLWGFWGTFGRTNSIGSGIWIWIYILLSCVHSPCASATHSSVKNYPIFDTSYFFKKTKSKVFRS